MKDRVKELEAKLLKYESGTPVKKSANRLRSLGSQTDLGTGYFENPFYINLEEDETRENLPPPLRLESLSAAKGNVNSGGTRRAKTTKKNAKGTVPDCFK